jgi:peptidyl-prolyl cis-trans isomerase D
MLQKIRDRATGPLAWFVVGIICVPFAFFGIEAFRSNSGANDVAKVGKEEISDAQLRQQYEQRYQQLQDMLGENFRSDMINPETLRQSVLDGLIQDSVDRQYLSKQEYRISDTNVLGFIRAQDAFQDKGNFSPKLYQDRLARQGMNPIQYEDRVRAYLASQQLRQAVTNSTVLTEQELKQAYQWEKQARRFNYRVYNAEMAAKTVTVAEDAIAKRYEERKATLLAPERVRLEYVELDRNVLKSSVPVDEEALLTLYEAEKNTRFRTAEERLARHILIRASEPDAEAQILALAKELVDGKKIFADLAKENSQDPGSKNKGGDLGRVTRGMMVKPFEDALFGLQAGAVSAPVKTDFGWHLIKLEEIVPAKVRPFEDASIQVELKDLYQDRKAREEFEVLAEKLEQVSFENPSSLKFVADQLKLEIKQSEWLTREGGAGIAAQESVITAAFSDVVLRDKENSLPVSSGDKHIVLRVLEHEVAREQTLLEVRDELTAELRSEAVASRLEELAKADLARLEAGEVKLADLADTEIAKNQKEQQVLRTDTQPNRSLVGAVFALDMPVEGAVKYQWLPVYGSNDVAVVGLTEVVEGAWSDASNSDKTAARQRLLAQRSNQEFAALQAALRDQTKVKIYRQSL